MKNKILLLLLLPLLFGCNDWLNVTPKEEVDEEELFTDGEGYRNALNGIYSKISGTNMYAQQLTWGFLDVVARYYNAGMMSPYGAYPKAYKGEYEDQNVRSILEGVWQGAFTAIANCNNLLQNIDKEEVIKFLGRQEEKNMLKGEALALRAFLHFDLLRLFAPVAVKFDYEKNAYVPSGDNNLYIPYCETHPAIFQNRETVNGVLDKAVRDLLEAKTLLATFDTISEVRKSQLSVNNRILAMGGNMENELFYCFRGFRMNYYAITAMLARVYNYRGELKLAAEQAQEVIDNEAFKVTSPANAKRYEDIIFGLNNKRLTEYFSAYHTGSNKTLCIANTELEKIFGSYSYDARYTAFVKEGTANKVSGKYVKDETAIGGISNELIPIIRSSELSYIVGEYYASINEYAKAASYISNIRSTLWCYLPTSVTSMKDYHSLWITEAYSTFVGEGQLFYLYKKLDYEFYSGMNKDAAFVFTIPDSEDITLNQ